MKFCEIDKCLRCQNTDVIISYPIIYCKKCTATAFTNLGTELENVRFFLESHHINISIKENKTYIDGDPLINSLLPFDVTADKIITYLIFS